MREPWWHRVKQAVCRRFGHRETADEWVVWCKRCGWLLRNTDR